MISLMVSSLSALFPGVAPSSALPAIRPYRSSFLLPPLFLLARAPAFDGAVVIFESRLVIFAAAAAPLLLAAFRGILLPDAETFEF